MEEEKGRWVTILKRRVFIKENQTLTDAIKESKKFSEDLQNRLKAKLNLENPFIKEKSDTVDDIVNIIDKYKILEKIENSENKDYYIKNKNMISGNIKLKVHILCEESKYNKTPKLLSKVEFEKLSDKEYIRLYRGLKNSEKSAEEYIRDFKYGKHNYGTGRISKGTGIYTSIDENTAKEYGKNIKMAISKYSNIIEYKDLEDIQNNVLNTYNSKVKDGLIIKYGKEKGSKINDFILNLDTSSLAVFKGYDAIKYSKKGYYIILNRSKLIVEE